MNKYEITEEKQRELLYEFYYTGIHQKDIKKLTINEQAFLADSLLDNAINQIYTTFPKLEIVTTGSLQYNTRTEWLDGKQKRKPMEYVKLK